jgi:aldehyde dehydrogenase (NAD+)
MSNSGQSCRAPTRMLAPNALMPQVLAIAKRAAEAWTVGDPTGNSRMGPVVSERQWNRVQDLIGQGIAEGAELVAGGPGRPVGLDAGFYVRPTVFAKVANDMTIAREEIFGPVLCILGYDSEDEAVAIANDTDYGLGGYVQSRDLDHARAVAARIRAGYISLNNAGLDIHAPFGGYKRSGNGREFADFGFEEYVELKAICGFNPA